MIWKDYLKLSEIASYSKLARASKAPQSPNPRVNPIQTGLFWPSLDWEGGGGASNISPPPHPSLLFLKTTKDIDMKLTPLIKCREINLLLLSYLSFDVT